MLRQSTKVLTISLILFISPTSHSDQDVKIADWGEICSTHPLTDEWGTLVLEFGLETANQIRYKINAGYWAEIGVENTPQGLESIKGTVVKVFDHPGCNTIVSSSKGGKLFYIYTNYENGLVSDAFGCTEYRERMLAINNLDRTSAVKAFRDTMSLIDKSLAPSTFTNYFQKAEEIAKASGTTRVQGQQLILNKASKICANQPHLSFEQALLNAINQ